MAAIRPLIAVVDDDLPFVQLMRDFLTEEGYDTLWCTDGSRAYETIRHSMPGLVLLDIRMQEPTSGRMILDLIRMDPTTTCIPIIVCSASTTFLRDNEAQLRAANCDILEKPFELDALLARVRALLGSA